MPIPTEPIGSIPRPRELVEALKSGKPGIDKLMESAVQDTIRRFEETGSPVVTDGEQRKPSFATYPIHGLKNLAPGGATIPFADGHTRRLPKLSAGPFRYAARARDYLAGARKHSRKPVKQAVISASALSLLYPEGGLKGYSREDFLNDLAAENEADIRGCLESGAHKVQIDFTEGRLAVKLDPSLGLLKSFVGLNNRVLERFSADERRRIGVHTCPGSDQDSTHSADVDYSAFLPLLFELKAGGFYIELAAERDRARVLKTVKKYSRPDQTVFVGVTNVVSPRVETPEEVRDLVLLAARHIPVERLGTTDDCGFAPFADDVSTTRETAFAKVRARVEGTALAAAALGA